MKLVIKSEHRIHIKKTQITEMMLSFVTMIVDLDPSTQEGHSKKKTNR
jgi:hypothetical protein